MPVPDDFLARLKRACVFISGPDGTGTGYLVAPQRIGTALHVVKSWQGGQRYPVVIGIGADRATCQAYLLNSDPASDAAVLAFDETLNVLPLPVARGLERSVAWEGYGFPAVASTTEGFAGLPIDGQVKDPTATDNAGKPAILLYSDIIAAGNASPLHGFSGSPVIVAGALVGHLTKHIGDFDDRRRAAFGYVYACPIERVVGLLDISATRVTIEPPKLATIAEAIPAIAETEYHVFVSYRATDRKWAMSLVARLEGAGLRVFIDQRELVAGDYLSAQLESALLRSRAAVLLVSHGWLESPWCQQEANVLIKRAVEDTSFKLVPLRLDGSAMPPLLDSRLWLDFKDAPQAEGENLDRLLYALLGRAPRKTDSLEARTDAADVKVVDEFVANIKAAAVSTAERILAIIAEWNKTGSSDVAPVIAAAEVLIGKAQFELALQLLDAASPTLRVRQLRALVLSKIGKVDDAIELLEALRREGNADAETGGLLAGRYKALWLKQGDRGYLVAAYRTYRDTYDVTRNSFNGINAAAMALHLGDQTSRYRIAGEVRDDLLKLYDAKVPLDHWELATLAEACVLLEKFDEAKEWYGRTVARAAGLHQDIAVMRRQARLNCKALGKAQDTFDGYLPVPRVLAYFGHMVDAQGRVPPRFPAGKVGALRRIIRERLDKYGALHGFGQAARGTDLIVLDELMRRDLTASVVLPFPETDYMALSVGDAWSQRYAQLKGVGRIEFTPPIMPRCPSDLELPSALAEANREVQKRAVKFAQSLDEIPIVLAVWDGSPGDGPGGTADAVALWRDEGYEVDVVDITKI